jgi:hypothetical protein
MKSLHRHAANALTILAFLLFVLTLALWLRSFVVTTSFDFSLHRRSFRASAAHGGVSITNAPELESWDETYGDLTFRLMLAKDHCIRVQSDINYFEAHREEPRAAELPKLWRDFQEGVTRYRALLQRSRSPAPPQPASMSHSLPFAFPCALLLTAALPSAVVLRWRTNRRRRRFGACFNCGYDLRATPDLCPECGTPAKGSA